MAKKNISFKMDATMAMKARDFLAYSLSKRTPEEWSRQKTAARKMLEFLETAIRLEMGPRGEREVSLRPTTSLKAAKKSKKR